jgi:DNA repair protein RecN (Recombination protein N)
MISHLRIRNVALIDEVEVGFGPGLNVLTGETGAGKSIVVDSIVFLLGERPGKDFIRTGAEAAQVEGIFEIETTLSGVLKAFDIEGLDDGQLFIERMQTAKKTVCKVNGRTVTVGMLKEISALLVDVHGQHEHQSLLQNNT